MIRCGLLLLWCFMGVQLFAQYTLKGRVIGEDGLPVVEANVSVDADRGNGTSTDSAGCFCLQVELPVYLKISHLNYREMNVWVTRDTFLILVLETSTHRLQEVVAKGKETGATYTSDKLLKQMPAILGEQDILKYMALLPGVVRPNILEPGIYVRGGNSIENAFLVNDVEIAGPSHLTGILSVFDPWILGNSRLYKSGFPARYGNYLSAYLNMKPSTERIDDIKGEVTVGLLSSALKYRGRLGKGNTTYAVSARTSYLQYMAKLYNEINDGTDMPEYAYADLTATVSSYFENGLSLSVLTVASRDRLKMLKDKNRKESVDWGTFSLNANLSYHWGKNFLYGKAGFRSHLTNTDLKKSIHLDAKNQRQAFSVETEYRRYQNDMWHWNIGARVEHGNYDFDGLQQWGLENVRQNIYTLYAQMEYSWGNATLRSGLNYQHYDGKRKEDSWSPRFKLTWRQNGWNVWADVSKTVQYESLWTVLNLKSPVDIWYPLAEGMRPAACWQYSGGVEYALNDIWHIYGALFWKKMNRLKDFTSVGFSEDMSLDERQVMGKGKNQGFEAEITADWQNVKLRTNYTWTDSWCRFKEINRGKRLHPPYDIRHSFLVSVSYRFLKRWTLNAVWNYASGTYATFPVGVGVAQDINDPSETPDFVPIYRERYNFHLPAQHQLDVSIDYTKQLRSFRWKCTLGVYNLYNRQNASLVHFEVENYEKYYTRFIPYSTVLLPAIPYISFTLNW